MSYKSALARPRSFRGDLDQLPGDVAYLTTVFVNVIMLGVPGSNWILVDAGLRGMARRIRNRARERFGEVPPAAIVLTHGHFDHVGSLEPLLAFWPDVPVYIHARELPHMTGQSRYLPPEPKVGGGLMSLMSPLYPRGPFDFGERVRALPADGTVPTMPEWTSLETPGHSPGHVSLFRERDRTLIAGDAFVTQRQESLLGALSAAPVVKGPPMYFTPDWDSARRSIEHIAALRPELAVTGHGHAVGGYKLAEALTDLADHFDSIALPKRGRYVTEDTRASSGPLPSR